MSRSINFLLIAAISAVVLSGCKKERSFRGANPGDEIVFGGTAGSASGFRSSKTKGGDGDSSVAGAFAVTDLDSCGMNTCSSYVRDDSDADETYYFDWEDFEGGDGFGGGFVGNEVHDASSGVNTCKGLLGSAGSESLSGGESGVSCGGGISEAYSENRANGVSSFGGSDAGNGLFGVSENDVQTKTDYSGHKENVGGKDYERIDWVVGDKVKIFADGVAPPKTECVYEVSSHATVSGIRSSGRLRPFNESDGHGLMWGSGNADFYAVYPGDNPSKLSVINGLYLTLFDVTVKLPEEQNTFTKTTSGNHTEVRPDMELAAMMAVSRDVPPASSVQLDFLPLVTTFRISIGNPSTTDDITINSVSIGYSPLSSTPIPMSGDYRVIYDKTGGSTLSSHLQLMPVDGTSVQNASFDGVVGLSSVPGGPVLLPKKNGSTVSSMSVTLFAVPVQHKGLQLKINVTQGGNTEDRILNLEKKQINPYAPAEQLEFEAYRKYDINVGIRNKMEYHLEVDPPYTYYNYLNGYIAPKAVRSYKTDGSTIYPASWWVEGYSESGENGPFTSTKPAWLNDFTQHGNGVNNPTASEPVTANVSAQLTPTITSNARTTALRGKSEVGTNSAPIDLSKVPVGTSPFFSIQDGATASTFNSNPMNTANCYVVTRPGWYKIPVVYGNAYKNGAPNTSAYTSSKSGNNVLQNFIRHDENSITAPWIKDNINLDSGVAELVWQDQPNLVQNIQLQSDKKYIVFYVSQATIHEGNAVIALKESASGDIVWSWHIWVYGGDDLRSINVKNNKGKSGGRPGQDNFDFLSENLGSCYDGDITSYPEGNVWVKISNGRNTEVIKITRLGRVLLASYYNVSYYQWGRKDPMLSGRVGSMYSKVWYDNSGVSNSNFLIYTWPSSGSVVQAKNEIANTIKHPNTFNRYQGMDYRYDNLWDTKCNETGGYRNITAAIFEAATKSVYDPCPPGFCLPPNGAFTGFTRSGNLASQSSEFNIAYHAFHEGYYFHTVLIEMQSWGSTYESIFFPVSGYRYYNGIGVGFCQNMKISGHYWSSSSYNMQKGDYLLFFDGNVRPLEMNDRSFGYAVRPVAEN